jgi:hypothetical protein
MRRSDTLLSCRGTGMAADWISWAAAQGATSNEDCRLRSCLVLVGTAVYKARGLLKLPGQRSVRYYMYAHII